MKLVQATSLLDTGNWAPPPGHESSRISKKRLMPCVGPQVHAPSPSILSRQDERGEERASADQGKGSSPSFRVSSSIPEGLYPSEEDAGEITRPGAFNARLDLVEQLSPFVVEWETGDILPPVTEQ